MGISALSWHFSPNLQPWQQTACQALQSRLKDYSDKIWIPSSGTQSVNSVKAIGLSARAMNASAQAVNLHLSCTAKDRWLIAIPEYHVGGLAIQYRARLVGAAVDQMRAPWSSFEFLRALVACRSTLTSLVPTQIFDLVKAKVPCPPDLRAVIVGGGHLTPQLYQAARALGWPLLPSYGLTETGSQIATAPVESLKWKEYPALKILSHAEVELREQRVCVRTQSLCDLVATMNTDGVFTLEDPRRDGFFLTEDLGEWHDGGLVILGRRDRVIKILGVLVSLQDVEADLERFFESCNWREAFAVVALPDDRAGARLVLLTDSSVNLRQLNTWVQQYNKTALGIRRLHTVGWLPKLPRSGLDKLHMAELTALFLDS